MNIAKICVVGIKSETTQNTAVTLSATDYLLAEVDGPHPIVDFKERNYYRTSLDRLPSIATLRYLELKLKTELKGSGTRGTAYAPLGAIFKAAGFSETVQSGTSVTYNPTSVPATNHFTVGQSATIEVYKGTTASGSVQKWVIAGAVATSLKIDMEAGKEAIIDVTFRGLFQEMTNSNMPATLTYNTLLPPTLAGNTVTIQGTSGLILKKMSIDVGLETVVRESSASNFGVWGLSIVGRSPKGSMTIEIPTISSQNVINRLVSNNEGSTQVTIGSANGNTNAITLPKTQYIAVKNNDVNGITVFDIDCQFNQNTGDDWISIVQT